jgi:hypothetical protein
VLTCFYPCCADEEDLEGELTEGYRGAADIIDLLWDEEEKGLNPSL